MLDNIVRKHLCDLTARRPGAWWLGVAVCLTIAVFAAAPRATAQPKPLISREYQQYQAKTPTRVAHASPPRFAVARPLARTRRGSALRSAIRGRARVRRYHVFVFQYQLPFQISQSNNTDKNQVDAQFVPSNGHQGTEQAISHPIQNLQPIHQGEAPQSGDERRLLEIGLALAIVYVVFLVLWFWGTRERGRRFEGAPRF
jgi:hypothetical protein